jgi:ribulose 1,5-bisphosphate synthetase/thiazole synthase
MDRNLSRRDLIRLVGATGLAGALVPSDEAWADPASRKDAPPGVKVEGTTAPPAVLVDGKVIQPERRLPLLAQTDVLVVGGGPSGVVAALAAKRTGAQVTLVERYGHFGGQWTGGLVLVVAGMHDKTDKQVIQGIGEEMLKRLEKLDQGIINRRRGVDPTVDAEAVKYVMVEMLQEAGVRVFLHCWGVDAVMEGGAVRGAVFESKSGRQAVLAKQVVDATGDGDVFAAAGAEYERIRFHVGLVCRIGNLDKVDQAKAKSAKRPRRLGGPTPIPGINWVNMHGPPDVDCLDVAELTRLEISHRQQIWKDVEKIRSTPGYEKVYLVETAPQLGVRMSRMLAGTERLKFDDVMAGKKYTDCIGVGGDWRATRERIGEWQIPYGVLVPKRIDNVLAAGRCVSGDPRLADHLRIIPTCFLTGHAAGCAAALAVQDGCPPRHVDVPKLQKLLKEQDAYLG